MKDLFLKTAKLHFEQLQTERWGYMQHKREFWMWVALFLWAEAGGKP